MLPVAALAPGRLAAADVAAQAQIATDTNPTGVLWETPKLP